MEEAVVLRFDVVQLGAAALVGHILGGDGEVDLPDVGVKSQLILVEVEGGLVHQEQGVEDVDVGVDWQVGDEVGEIGVGHTDRYAA